MCVGGEVIVAWNMFQVFRDLRNESYILSTAINGADNIRGSVPAREHGRWCGAPWKTLHRSFAVWELGEGLVKDPGASSCGRAKQSRAAEVRIGVLLSGLSMSRDKGRAFEGDSIAFEPQLSPE